MSAPYSSSGEPSMWNGPSTVAGVAPLSRRWFIWTTSIDRPSTSEARMNSSRFSSLICPVRVSHWMAAIHSASVSRTSRAKSCRWRTSAVHDLREPRVVRGAPARRGQLGDVVLGDQLHLDSCDSSAIELGTQQRRRPGHGPHLALRGRPRQVLHPAVGRDHQLLAPAGTGRPAAPVRRRPRRVSTSGVDRSSTPEDDRLVGQVGQHARGRARTARSRSRSGRPGSRPARAGTSSPAGARG